MSIKHSMKKMTHPPNKIKPALFMSIHFWEKKNGKQLLDFLFFIVSISVPRYVRVNTIVSSIAEVCHQLSQEGWNRVQLNKKKASYSDFIEKVKQLEKSQFMTDYHLDFLLVFPPSTKFFDHPLLLNGSILLQDKVIIDIAS